MQVLSDGRVRRTSAEWEEIIARQRESGVPIATFCEKEEISRSAFASWRRKLSESREKPASFVELTHPRTNPALKPAKLEPLGRNLIRTRSSWRRHAALEGIANAMA